MKKTKKFFMTLLIIFGIGLVGYYFYINFFGEIKKIATPTETAPIDHSNYSIEFVSSDEIYPDLTDKEVFSREKELSAINDGEMTLKIPAISVDSPVLKGTTTRNLKKSVACYDFSDAPGKGNRNLSIAGHRDIYGAEFYNIDKIGENDKMYVFYKDKVYVYSYVDTKICKSNDWSRLERTGQSLLTLTSCHPLHTSEKRIITHAVLTEIWTEKN